MGLECIYAFWFSVKGLLEVTLRQLAGTVSPSDLTEMLLIIDLQQSALVKDPSITPNDFPFKIHVLCNKLITPLTQNDGQGEKENREKERAHMGPRVEKDIKIPDLPG